MMWAKIEPTGTQVDNGLLKLRLDCFLDNPNYKTYAKQHIFNPVTGAWQLNPAICQFITVPEVFTQTDLERYAHEVFTPDIIATLDDVLVLPNSAHYVSPLMRSRGKFANKRVSAKDVADLISSVNERLNFVVPLEGGGKAFTVEPQTIAVGSAAINRPDNLQVFYTHFNVDNPSNATGVLDTVETWFDVNGVAVVVGTFFLVSGTTYQVHDSESIGNVTAGAKGTITGLTIAVATNEFIGCYGTSGNIEKGYIDYLGVYYTSGEHIDPGDSAVYTLNDGETVSLYATGTETGGWTHIAKVNGVAVASIAKVNGVAVASIAKFNGVAV